MDHPPLGPVMAGGSPGQRLMEKGPITLGTPNSQLCKHLGTLGGDPTEPPQNLPPQGHTGAEVAAAQ